MICSFCNEVIHFYEEFYAVKGYFFHLQVVTDHSIRCKKVKLLPKLIEVEKKLKGGQS